MTGLAGGVALQGPDGAVRDATWFERLYRAHSAAIYTFCARRAALDDAGDLAAEVFAVAWRRRADLPTGELELPWLYRTAWNVVSNHWRKMSAVPVPDLTLELAMEVSRDNPELAAIENVQLRAALAALSERDREILLLSAWDGVTGTRLAEVLGVSRGGADAALSRARSRLIAAWRQLDQDETDGAGERRPR